jgi:hypothetical protein
MDGLLRHFFRLVIVMIPVALSPAHALAAPILLTTSYVRWFFEPSNPAFDVCVNNSGPCDGSALAPGTNWAVNYHSESAAAFGILRGEASLFLTGDNSLGPLDGGAVSFPHLVSVGARAGFRDSYTISGGTGPGTVTFAFAVTGAGSASSGASARPQFQWVPALPTGGLDFSNQINYTVVGGVASVSLPITFDVPFEGAIFFYSLAQILTASGWTIGAFANADFSNTATMNGITVRDSLGNSIDFSIISGSGTSYTSAGVLSPVPEPMTSLLLTVGLVGLSGRVLTTRRLKGRRRGDTGAAFGVETR